MACLNLWNIFKDWFDGKYQKKNSTPKSEYSTPKQENIPNIIGKSKPVFREASKTEKPDEEKQRLEKEVLELKRQLKEKEKNEPFMSIDLLEEEQPNVVDTEESEDFEEVYHNPSEKSGTFNRGTTVDEFELMAKALTDKPINKEEEKEVGYILTKVIGTEFYNQFTKQVYGAENLAMTILNQLEDGTEPSGNENFDFSRYIRT